MSDFNFKQGDLVYCPIATNEVLKVTPSLNIRYKDTNDYNRSIGVYDDGKWTDTHHNPAIFPATQEWYDKLVHIYPDLEKPPVKKTPKEIIQAMLDDGWDCVPCYVHDENKTPNKNNRREIISEARNYSNYPFVTDTVAWKYAIPFDPKTGKTIVDYVDGEVVLEG